MSFDARRHGDLLVLRTLESGFRTPEVAGKLDFDKKELESLAREEMAAHASLEFGP